MDVGFGKLGSERAGEELALRVHLGVDLKAYFEAVVLEAIVSEPTVLEADVLVATV